MLPNIINKLLKENFLWPTKCVFYLGLGNNLWKGPTWAWSFFEKKTLQQVCEHGVTLNKKMSIQPT